MSELPPTPPTPATPPGPPSMPVDPQKAVQLPAMALMGAAVSYILWIFFIIAGRLFSFAMVGTGGSMSFLAGTSWLIIQILFSLAFAGVIFYGAMQMKNLRNYNMAMAAAIVSILPCSYCCCITIGVGIWALVVLMKPEVKAAFTK